MRPLRCHMTSGDPVIGLSVNSMGTYYLVAVEPFFHRILLDVYLCYTILKLYQPVNLLIKGIWFNKRDILAHFKIVLNLFGCFYTEL